MIELPNNITQQSIALLQAKLGVKVDGIDGLKTQAAFDAFRDSEGRSAFSFCSVTGLDLDEYGDPDWCRSQDAKGDQTVLVRGVSGSFVPQGVMIHHTAGPAGREQINAELLAQGRSGLRGPLVQVGVSRDGGAAWITNGRAQHAGAGWSGALPANRNNDVTYTGTDDTYGNSYFLGIEIDNSGNTGDIYPAEQLDRAYSIATFWCKAFGWTAKHVIGHKEWTKRKVDPSLDMSVFRDNVSERLLSEALVDQHNPQLEDRIESLEEQVRALIAWTKR